MKKLYFLIIFSVLFAAPSMAGKLKAHLNYSTFYSPDLGPYIETYLMVEGNTVQFIKNDNNKFQATVEVLVLFKIGDEIKEFNKYEVSSPELLDTLGGVHLMINFMDQQRYTLPNGEYNLEFELSDKYSSEDPIKVTQAVTLNYPDNKIAISDIMIVDSYSDASDQSVLTRGGLNLIPGVFNFFPNSRNELTYYTEIYNADKIIGENEKYLLTTFLENEETGQKVSEMGRMKREEAKSVNTILNKFDIKTLPSGNYNVVVEVRDKTNKLITSKRKFIQRSNPVKSLDNNQLIDSDLNTKGTFVEKIQPLDSLREAIRCMLPIMDMSGTQFVRKMVPTASREVLERYMLSFWVTRGGLNAELNWKHYADLVRLAQEHYGTMVYKGYETDRGIILCRYEQPDHITEQFLDPGTYPYEIWQYYDIANQRDRKFVFMTHDVSTKDFKLIHSNMVGELYNPHWVMEVHRLSSSGVDYKAVEEVWGNRLEEEYTNPH